MAAILSRPQWVKRALKGYEYIKTHVGYHWILCISKVMDWNQPVKVQSL